MEWDVKTRRKLARRIRELSLEIQNEEFSRNGSFAKRVESTIKRIMIKLAPLGFEPANKDWTHLEEGTDATVNLYLDSPTHLWFETAQCRIVKIHKEHAEKLLVLDLP